MSSFFKKSQEALKEDVVFTENHSVEIADNYVGSISVDKSGKYSLRLVPSCFYVTLTEERLEKILAKLKDLNANVPVSR